MTKLEPGLFAQNHNNSNRDYSQEYYWGKNQFNSSFPASLVANMSYKGVKPVYLCTDKENHVIHKYISGTDLFRINPLAENAYLAAELKYPFRVLYKVFREGKSLIDVKIKNKPIVPSAIRA